MSRMQNKEYVELCGNGEGCNITPHNLTISDHRRMFTHALEVRKFARARERKRERERERTAILYRGSICFRTKRRWFDTRVTQQTLPNRLSSLCEGLGKRRQRGREDGSHPHPPTTYEKLGDNLYFNLLQYVRMKYCILYLFILYLLHHHVNT